MFLIKKLIIEYKGDFCKDLGKIYSNMGEINESLGKIKDAFEYYTQAEKIYSINGNNQGIKKMIDKKQNLLVKK